MFDFLKSKEQKAAEAASAASVAVIDDEQTTEHNRLLGVDKKRRKNKDTNLNTIAELYVEQPSPFELSHEELEAKISKNKKAIEFLKTEKYETTFTNEVAAYTDTIEKLTKQTANMQVQLLQSKFEGQYTKIDLSFLSMKKENKDMTEVSITSSNNGPLKDFIPYVPAFSVHKLSKSGNNFVFAQCVFELKLSGTVGEEKGLSEIHFKNLPHSVIEKLGKVFTNRTIEPRDLHGYSGYTELRFDLPRTHRQWFTSEVALRQSFNGMIPSTTKKHIAEAYDKFTEIMDGPCEIFLIKECEEWDAEVITKDPFVVGMIGEQAYLIDHFDCTDLEAYVNSEFTS